MKAARLPAGARTPAEIGHGIGIARPATRPAVLVLCDDGPAQAVLTSTLTAAGFRIETADSRTPIAATGRRSPFDFVLVGRSLADDDLLAAARRLLSPVYAPPPRIHPRSAAQRWAALVMKACESDDDLRTLAEWASFAGVSYTSLCERCRLVNVRPHDARNLARVLRAVLRCASDGGRPATLLDVSDRRTLKALLDKAGIGLEESNVSVDRLFQRQQFIPGTNDGLIALRARLGSHRTGATRG